MDTRLAFDTYLAHLQSETARFREVLERVEPSARVPGCPDWDAADLLDHLRGVQAFWADVVERRPEEVDEDALPDHPRAGTWSEQLADFDLASERLVAALTSADPAEEAWHWSSDRTVGATYRRQAHEALIHRLDAEETAGVVTALDPRLAADGVDEAFRVMYGGCPPWGTITPTDDVVLVRLTDTGHEFPVALARFTGTDPEGKTYDEGDLAVLDSADSPAATVSGTAADLDTWIWARGLDRVRLDHELTVEGDRAVFDRLAAILQQPLN